MSRCSFFSCRDVFSLASTCSFFSRPIDDPVEKGVTCGRMETEELVVLRSLRPTGMDLHQSAVQFHP